MQNYNKYLSGLSDAVKQYVLEKAEMCRPDNIHICDGSEEENRKMIDILLAKGAIKPLPKYKNCWLVRTDPADVARVESKTFISTEKQETTIPLVKSGILGKLGNWKPIETMKSELTERFTGCMKGRTMYVIPFSMGSVGGQLSKIGIELTDSPYVVASMRIMTRIGSNVLCVLGNNDDFVKALHSVGVPLPTESKIINGWPCNPERTIIAHLPESNEICSFGSGYGGNSLLGKKCFALRLGSILGHKEGWLAEHMLILGISDQKKVKRYIAAAFPSACGKTNLAMLESALPGYKIECVGDDIAWMKFDNHGQLRAINPESGFFGVAPGTSFKTNPNAMRCIQENTIFTNVAETSDGGFYWEGMEDEVDLKSITINDWRGNPWNPLQKTNAAHPNSRFCTPASQCPIIDSQWESSKGVVISAIIFGGRRPEGVPLIYEAMDWDHGVFLGATMRSESTAAAEHKSNVIMHDPFAMRPFFGYNFGEYLQHWLSFNEKSDLQLPTIYHVNWFRKSQKTGKFIWPGFGENSRVLEWILKRLDGSVGCQISPIGYLPYKYDINMEGLDPSKIDLEELFSVPYEFWSKEIHAIREYFEEQVGDHLPNKIRDQLNQLEKRLEQFHYKHNLTA